MKIYTKIIFLSFLFFTSLQANFFADSILYAQRILTKPSSRKIFKSLFVPYKEPDAKKVLCGLIDNEKKSISFAQYVLSDKEITEALSQAHARGVKIQGIVDHSALHHGNEKVTDLVQQGIDILVYKKPYSIMHNKYYVFEENFFGKPVVFMGSANASFSGFRKNKESIMVFNNKACCQTYKKEFRALQKEVQAQKMYSTQKQREQQTAFYMLLKTFREFKRLIFLGNLL
ncbi:MAG: phospholipase D-like domain-containing protein [Candidatus Babeliales bacterium]